MKRFRRPRIVDRVAGVVQHELFRGSRSWRLLFQVQRHQLARDQPSSRGGTSTVRSASPRRPARICREAVVPGVRTLRCEARVTLASAETTPFARNFGGIIVITWATTSRCRRGSPTGRSFRAVSMHNVVCTTRAMRRSCPARPPPIKSTIPKRDTAIRNCLPGPTSRCWPLTICLCSSR